MFKQPMLAKDYDPSRLEFPVWASPKIDGYRCVIHEGAATTRTGKKFRNAFVQSLIGVDFFNGLDGELVVGEPSAPDVYNKSSAVMKATGSPKFTFWVFDDFTNPEHDYETRFSRAANAVAPQVETVSVKILPQVYIADMEALDKYEAEQIELGFEGIMVRKVGSPYKHGRSTVNEGYLLKVKRFAHEEGVIIGGEELMHNGNEAYKNEAGKTMRSDAKDGLYPSGMLGAYILHNPKYAKFFKVSCGSMSHEERKAALESLQQDKGRALRYKFLPHGTKDVPRHGLYAGFRDPDDLPAPADG